MTAGREAFLERVRQAVAEGNRVGGRPALRPRGTVGYQGAGPDPVARFQSELTAAGGRVYLTADAPTAVEQVLELIRAKGAQRVLVGRGAVLNRLALPERLRSLGLEAVVTDELPSSEAKETLFAADVGVSGAHALIAETGSVVVASAPAEPRSLSLLPPIHVVVADHRQILPDLFDLFAGLGPDLPSCLTIITGPSKTGDIELRLVTGVHGPAEVHVVLLTE
jgi:L-lactate dehydrogenase complex protein LldG